MALPKRRTPTAKQGSRRSHHRVAVPQLVKDPATGGIQFLASVRRLYPQAVRIAIPPTVGFMVQIVKNTSLASVIGFVELARAGQIVNNSTFEPFAIFTAVAIIYFAICYPLSLAARTLERRAHAGR